MDELISVIIPIYKVEEYLQRCIESVLAQTHTNLEVILVDDGSPDRCPAICDEYAVRDSRIRVIHKENAGVSAARNTALDMMHGAYVTFIDSDDYVDSAYVDTLYRLIRESKADISVCAWREVEPGTQDPGQENVPGTDQRTDYDTVGALRALLYQIPFDSMPWCKLYRAELFDGIRFPDGRVYEDFAILYRVMDRAKRVSYLPYCGYRYLLRDSGTELQAFSERKMALIDFADEMKAYLPDKYPELEAAVWSRFFRANCHIYLQVPDDEGHKAYSDRLESNMRLSCRRVLFDPQSRRGTRGAALCCIFPGCKYLRKLRKWKKLGKH